MYFNPYVWNYEMIKMFTYQDQKYATYPNTMLKNKFIIIFFSRNNNLQQLQYTKIRMNTSGTSTY